MLDPATARLCVWRLPLEAAFRLFSKLGSLGGSIRERFSRTGRTKPALARPAFSRWLLENDRLRERWPCQWLNVLYFPFSETSPYSARRRLLGRRTTRWQTRTRGGRQDTFCSGSCSEPDFPHLILDFFSATFATRLTKFARFRDSHRLAPACGRYADDG